MDERDYKSLNKELQEFPTEPCCEVLEKLDIYWMTNGDEKLMPYITSIYDNTLYRVNHCPSCGSYIRNITLKK